MQVKEIKQKVLYTSVIGIGIWVGLSIVRLARRKRSEHFMWHVLPILTPSVAFLLSKMIAPWVDSSDLLVYLSFGLMVGVVGTFFIRAESEPLETHIIGRRENGTSLHVTLSLSASVRDVENAFSTLLEAPITLQTLQGERLLPSDEPLVKRMFQAVPKADALGQVDIELFVVVSDGPIEFASGDLSNLQDRKNKHRNYSTQSIRNIPKQMRGKMKRIQSIVMRTPQQLLEPALFHSGDSVLVRALLRVPSSSSRSYQVSQAYMLASRGGYAVVEPPKTQTESGKKKTAVNESEKVVIWKWDIDRRAIVDPDNLSVYGEDVDEEELTSIAYGDPVVFSAGGRFMSVYQEWWMAWSNEEPRRSGVFVLEAPSEEGSDAASNSSNTNALDSNQQEKKMRVLLRSHKYLGTELGVAKQHRMKGGEKKERYVGLQSMEPSGSDSWLYSCEFHLISTK